MYFTAGGKLVVIYGCAIPKSIVSTPKLGHSSFGGGFYRYREVMVTSHPRKPLVTQRLCQSCGWWLGCFHYSIPDLFTTSQPQSIFLFSISLTGNITSKVFRSCNGCKNLFTAVYIVAFCSWMKSFLIGLHRMTSCIITWCNMKTRHIVCTPQMP